jgi:membrane-associated phospholipid phosphatase
VPGVASGAIEQAHVRAPVRPRLASAARAVRPGVVLVGFVALVYAVLCVAVLSGSPLVELDSAVLRWAPSAHWPALEPVLSAWVLLGQRAICLALAAVWLTVRAVRTRDLRPLLTLGAATLLLNVSVGLVKTVVGRLGPLELGAAAVHPGASTIFTDGTIFPSGHTANAVVTWGLLAWLARGHRRAWGLAAAFMAVSIGLTTIYLGTHWVSDVLAGWAAGGLVLLALPALTPLVDRLDAVAATVLDRLRGARRALTARMPSCPPTRTAVSRTVRRPSSRVTVS